MESAERNLILRRMEPRDVDAVLDIQEASPEIARWTAADYGRAAEAEMAAWVAQETRLVAGFLVARRIGEDIEILNLAVRPENRRLGIATALLQEAFQWGGTFEAEKVFLEVRASNLAALRFYALHGFDVTGRRAQYYSAPIEDALTLTASLRLRGR
jgi:[ribosomal protein S18]-alanine N-acetyltransferase